MSKQLPSIILAFLTVFTVFSQSSEKVKGNRIVTTKTTKIEKFNKLIIKNNFKLNIKQGDQTAIEISTDENLHEVIAFNIDDSGSLSFKKNKRITSSKAMDITVIFKDSLNVIELKENAQLTSIETLKLQNFTLKTKESSKVFLTIEADTLTYNSAGKSKAQLNVKANTISLKMNDNSNLKALFTASTIKMNLLQRANAKIEGNTDVLDIKADNNALLKADLLEAKNCNIFTEGKTDIHIQTIEKLTVEVTGTSEIYIYGRPKIDLINFDDAAILRKK